MIEYCPNCGEEREEKVQVCPFCGQELEDEAVLEEKDVKIDALQEKITQLEHQAIKSASLQHQVDDLQHELKKTSKNVRKARWRRNSCYYICAGYVILMVILFLISYLPYFLLYF